MPSPTSWKPRADGAPSPLRVRGLTVAYGAEPVVDDVGFELAPAQLVAIVGPNGGGKSTMLRATLGLEPARDGAEVEFFGRPLAEVRRRVAYMPQREQIDWHFPARVIDVVLMGLYGEIGWLRRLRGEHRDAARAALDRVGMLGYAKRQIGELSGGEQKRVFLARTIVQGAELFIMDEPFAGIDAVSQSIIERELEALRDGGATVVVVHHDLVSVLRTFDSCVLLNRHVRGTGPVGEVLTAERVADAYGGVVPLALVEARQHERFHRTV